RGDACGVVRAGTRKNLHACAFFTVLTVKTAQPPLSGPPGYPFIAPQLTRREPRAPERNEPPPNLDTTVLTLRAHGRQPDNPRGGGDHRLVAANAPLPRAGRAGRALEDR